MVQCENKNMFEPFFDNRSSLIIQYKNGDISKTEFLEYNFDLVKDMDVEPFEVVDSYEKGMYNYQYFNVLAKYYTKLAQDLRRAEKDDKYYIYYNNMGNNYYNEKDNATVQLLRFLDFERVEAYFIDVKSEFLKNKLYEIVLLDHKQAIFHSKSYWLLQILKEEGVFIEGMRTSLIDGYINERY